ncbi:MAG: acetate--CoA ligase family protein [Proteobacteria bacterium]|nr:acetate--CoA ligase family protein [Pseudomonadota bacterium]
MFKPISTILKPRSIAIVGASERARWPGIIYSNLLDHGYGGKVYPVNPRYREIWGVRCHPSLDAVGEPIDHAVIIVPAAGVLEIIKDGVEAGIKSATVYAAGIGDGETAEAQDRGRRLVEICARSGLIVAGPNCMGAMSWREKLFLYPNSDVGNLAPGAVGVVFQSGGTLQTWVRSSGARGIRFSYAISSGNELNVDLADYLNFLIDDAETRIIALFIESIRRGDAFKAAAARALDARKPILVVKSGRSERAAAAALSHTGAIAGDWAAFGAMCERYGIVQCPTLDDLTESVLAFTQARLAKGPGIGFVTTSGGSVNLLYDYAEETGATFPEFAPETVARLRPGIAPHIAIRNPLDCGIPSGIETQAMFCRAVLDDPNIDMIALASRAGRVGPEEAAPLKALAAGTEKPVIAFERMRYPLPAGAIEYQDDLAIPHLQGLPETLRALAALAFYGARAGKTPRTPPAPAGDAAGLEGPAFDALLNAKGVTLPKCALVPSATEAAAAATAIGLPVALKIVAPAYSHKPEIGGVLLGLGTAEAVAEGAAALEARVRAVDAKALITGYLVQEMVSGVEMIVGCRDDATFGPVVLLGAGGVHVELIIDASLRLLPVEADDVSAMIGELKAAELLAGFRGQAPADTEALIRAVVGLGEIYLDHRHLLADLEVNPLIVRPNGGGVAAVDLRPVRRAPED